MASLKLLLISCFILYFTEPSLCRPPKDGRAPAPLFHICNNVKSDTALKSQALICFICKGLDHSCFTTSTIATTSSTTTTTPSTTTSSTTAPAASEEEE